jgi:hypothetical protein
MEEAAIITMVVEGVDMNKHECSYQQNLCLRHNYSHF